MTNFKCMLCLFFFYPFSKTKDDRWCIKEKQEITEKKCKKIKDGLD